MNQILREEVENIMEKDYREYAIEQKQQQLKDDIGWCINLLMELQESAFYRTSFNPYNKAEVNRKRIEINNKLMRY